MGDRVHDEACLMAEVEAAQYRRITLLTHPNPTVPATRREPESYLLRHLPLDETGRYTLVSLIREAYDVGDIVTVIAGLRTLAAVGNGRHDLAGLRVHLFG